MHERYASSGMQAVWSDDARYGRWREVELAILAARADLGEIPATYVSQATAIPASTAREIAEAEAVTRHDVVAFLNTWTANMPQDAARWVHRDVTSSDIVDTALALTVRAATSLLLEATHALLTALKHHALEHAQTPRLGRTHGMAAAPDVWGHRVADFAFAVARCRDRLRQAGQMISFGKISGVVGTYAGIDPRIEQIALERLGLRPAPVATQVIARDSLAEWMFALSVSATAAEAIALEIRHGQRFEVGELAEPMTTGQAGSSAMPHKRNPVLSEKVCGLARVVRSLVVPITEGMALWHERDISHSSTERVCLSDAAVLTEHILQTMATVVAGLEVNRERMAANLRSAGALAYSDGLLSLLIDSGIDRRIAYGLLQEAAVSAVDAGDYEEAVRTAAAAKGVRLPQDLPRRAVERTLKSKGLSAVFDRLASLR